MTDRPILFSGPMVRAILAGTKTQTRRLIADDWWRCLDPDDEDDRTKALSMCPYGLPGDRLWVRETHALHYAWDDRKAPAHRGKCLLWYRADADPNVVDGRGKWRPSIFTKRWASRITLVVESVRVERLQDITEADAWAEGIAELGKVTDPRGAYFALWDSINGKRAESGSNPWVWVVSWKEAEVRRAA